MIINYQYNTQLRKIILGIASQFDGISIGIWNQETGELDHTQIVSLLFPNQDKHFSYYNQKMFGSENVNKDVRVEISKNLPCFSLSDFSFSVDQERKRNKNDLICNSNANGYTPVPYKISFALKFNFIELDQCFQIMETLLPLYNDYRSFNLNQIAGFAENLSIPVFLDSTSNLFSSDVEESKERIQQFTFLFHADCWLFSRVTDNSAVNSTLSFT